MDRYRTVADRIIQAASQTPGCLVEELVLACPDLTWNQVFLEVDRLSRNGEIWLTLEGPGIYSIRPARKVLAS
jgi:hypothetical protein